MKHLNRSADILTPKQAFFDMLTLAGISGEEPDQNQGPPILPGNTSRPGFTSLSKQL